MVMPRAPAADRGPEKDCGEGNSQRQLRVGVRLRARVRRAPLLLQRAGLLAARRAGGGEARLRRPGARDRGDPGPARPRRQRRDPRAHLGARRAHRRALDRARRPRQPQPRPLDPPPGLPRRLARPARQGGRAGRRLRGRHPHLRLRPARPRLRADRALPRALLGSSRVQVLSRRARRFAAR